MANAQTRKLFPNRHTDAGPVRSGPMSPRRRRHAAERMAMHAHMARANATASQWGSGTVDADGGPGVPAVGDGTPS